MFCMPVFYHVFMYPVLMRHCFLLSNYFRIYTGSNVAKILLFPLQIFETFGPVKLPYYNVRKCPTTELKDLGISVGDTVFVVPSSDAMTKYVFTDRIRQYVKRQMVGNRFNIFLPHYRFCVA